MEITICDYSAAVDWDAVCDGHDRARPHEVRAFVPVEQIQPLSEIADEDGFFDGQQYVACAGKQVVGYRDWGMPDLDGDGI